VYNDIDTCELKIFITLHTLLLIS